MKFCNDITAVRICSYKRLLVLLGSKKPLFL